MDGLDEVMSGSQRLQMVRSVESFVNRYKQNRFVVTSRIVGYRAAPLAEDWYVITLTDFDLSDIEHFVKVWYQSSQLATFGQSATAGIEAEREARTLLAAIAANPYISALAANPLLLQVIVVVYQQRLRLPEHRVSLYDSSIRLLLETWNYARSLSEYVVGTSLDSHEATRILSQVALRVHESSATGLISEGDLRSVVTEVITEWGDNRIEALQRADEFLRMMLQRSTILMERGAGVYGFVHITFEEYLAACALAGQRASDRDRFVSSHLFDPRWREVILLLLARLSLIEGRRLETNDLLRLVLEIESDDAEQKGTGVLLAAEFLRDQGRREVDPQIRELIISRLAALFRHGSIPLASRLTAGTMLGELGHVPAVLSDMIQVPAGPFVMGGNPKANPKVYEDEQPLHEVVLPSFQIRKYLVTNLEYKQFLENGGYDAQMFWTQDGWRYRIGMAIGAPEYWDDDLWNRPNHPVVGISWYEARAYCAWLTEKLRAQDDLSHDEVIRLPTEAEWEKAAKGVWGHRQWPWGDAFDTTRANTAESGIGRTTPVGTYPTGASPYGVEDMAGNMWEWCSSLHRQYPYRPDDGRENLDESGQRVLRGGSWGDNHDYARTTFRGKAVPDARFSTIGFRYVRTTAV